MKPNDKDLYEKAVQLKSTTAAAEWAKMPRSTVVDAIRRHCLYTGKPRPDWKKITLPPTIPTGKELYDLVIKLGSCHKVADYCNCNVNTVIKHLKRYCKANNLTEPGGSLNKVPISFPNQLELKTDGIQRFIITSMHNNTPLHAGAFQSLHRMAEHLGAQFCIIPLLYKNPSLFTSAQAIDVEWPAEALQYTVYDNIVVNKDWLIAGKLHIQATAARPLQGMQGFSKERSCVVGHSRLAWETRPTPPGHPSIRQITTGSISEPQYSDTKLGQLSEFHHTLGALLLETDGTRTFVRHLRPSVTTGEFYDFEHHYSPSGYQGESQGAIDAVVFGDLHEWFSEEKTLILDFARRYKPLHTVIHDPIDSFSISPHHEKDPLMRVAKLTLGMGNLEREVGSLCEFHTELRNALPLQDSKIHYVASNHTDHILQWLKARDWQKIDPNSKVHRFLLNTYMEYLEDKTNALEYANTGNLPSILEVLMDRAGIQDGNTFYPSVNDSLMIHTIECGQHGHKGANGSKGTPNSFRQSQYKMIVGHMHTPGMYDGVYVVGTSGGLKMNYNDGLSSWDTVHATIDRFGKRRLFNTVAGKYRLEE